jgi:5'(3')-deoxyribonucleotidase
MDGVLADFFSEWEFLIGKNWRQITNTEDALDNIIQDKTFWLRLGLLENGKKIIAFFQNKKLKYNILSTPLTRDEKCINQKKVWINMHLNFYPPQQILFSENKEKYALNENGLGNILIDDFGKNIIHWKKKGGIGIKHKDHKFYRTQEKLNQII